MIAGVCGGIAEWLGWDPTLVRILYVVVSVVSVAFPGILAYPGGYPIAGMHQRRQHEGFAAEFGRERDADGRHEAALFGVEEAAAIAIELFEIDPAVAIGIQAVEFPGQRGGKGLPGRFHGA